MKCVYLLVGKVTVTIMMLYLVAPFFGIGVSSSLKFNNNFGDRPTISAGFRHYWNSGYYK